MGDSVSGGKDCLPRAPTALREDAFKTVETWHWRPDAPFARNASARRRPVLIRGTVASTWPALDRWRDDDYLVEGFRKSRKAKFPTQAGCDRAAGDECCVFLYSNAAGAGAAPVAAGRPLMLPEPAGFDAAVHAGGTLPRRSQMPLKEFLAGRDRGDFLYATFNTMDVPVLRRDLSPHLEWLVAAPVEDDEDGASDADASVDAVDESEVVLINGLGDDRPVVSAAAAAGGRRSHMDVSHSLFLSTAGSVAQTHYDSMHNFFVQVRGSKRFVLLPPSASLAMHLFPSLHPSRRQSQVNVRDCDPLRYPLLPPSFDDVVVVADLEPGDVLYLPPFWYHRVIADEFSLSVNTFLDSEEISDFEDVLREPMPLEDHWDTSLKTAGLHVFLSALAEEFSKLLERDKAGLGALESQKSPLTLLWESRYAPIWSTVVACDPRSADEGASSDQASGSGYEAELEASGVDAGKIKRRAREIAGLFETIKNRSKDDAATSGVAIAEVWLLNYCEEVLAHFVAAAEIPRFVRCVLAA